MIPFPGGHAFFILEGQPNLIELQEAIELIEDRGMKRVVCNISNIAIKNLLRG